MQLRATPAEREYKEKIRAKKKPITVYNDDDCLGQKMTIDKITVNLYICCKCNYQWTSWNGNQRAEEPIPKYCPKYKNTRWNQRYLDEELALVNRLQDKLYETNLIRKSNDKIEVVYLL